MNSLITESYNPTESEALEKLRTLCSKPGFIFSLAYIATKDGPSNYNFNNISAPENGSNYSHERLIPNELILLERITRGYSINVEQKCLPSLDDVLTDTKEAKRLLQQLHNSINLPRNEVIEKIQNGSLDPKSLQISDLVPNVWKEACFYSASSANQAQLRGFAVEKYKADEGWVKKHKQLSIKDAAYVSYCIESLRSVKYQSLTEKSSPQDFLEANLFTVEEIHARIPLEIDLSYETIERILETFSKLSTDPFASSYKTISDHNEVSVFPFINTSKGFLLLSHTAFERSLYQTPFFWFLDEDKEYFRTIYTQHRGEFVEDITYQLLKGIFGSEHTFKNVLIFDGEKEIGEIDVLVEWGGKALLVQNKSKMLTSIAKEGNPIAIKTFIQEVAGNAYGQCLKCAKPLLSNAVVLKDKDSQETITLDNEINEIFPLCIVGEDIPALTPMSTLFIPTSNQTLGINNPFIGSIFFLEAIAITLNSPTHFIHFLDRWGKTQTEIKSPDDYAILGWHMTHNLFSNRKGDILLLDENYSTRADMIVIGHYYQLPMPANAAPFLSRLDNTPLGIAFKHLDQDSTPKSIAISRTLLNLSQDDIDKINHFLIKNSSKYGTQSASLIALDGDFGLSFCSSSFTPSGAEKDLNDRIKTDLRRRPKTKWYGIALSKGNRALLSSQFINHGSGHSDIPKEIPPTKRTGKLGRNDPCRCGSGLKFKKCCGKPS